MILHLNADDSSDKTIPFSLRSTFYVIKSGEIIIIIRKDDEHTMCVISKSPRILLEPFEHTLR